MISKKHDKMTKLGRILISDFQRKNLDRNSCESFGLNGMSCMCTSYLMICHFWFTLFNLTSAHSPILHTDRARFTVNLVEERGGSVVECLTRD